MKGNFKAFMFLVFGSLLLSGCSNKSFFNTDDIMKPPELLKNQKEIKNAISNYIGDEIVWDYYKVNGRYCALFDDEWENNSFNSYNIAFCKSESHSEVLHIVFLFKENNCYEVIGEILSKPSNIEEIQIKDINEDGKNEILIYDCPDDENLAPKINSYSYSSSGIIKLDF